MSSTDFVTRQSKIVSRRQEGTGTVYDVLTLFGFVAGLMARIRIVSVPVSLEELAKRYDHIQSQSVLKLESFSLASLTMPAGMTVNFSLLAVSDKTRQSQGVQGVV